MEYSFYSETWVIVSWHIFSFSLYDRNGSSPRASLSDNRFIIRHPHIHQIPERFLVIFFSKMCELMDDDRVNEVWIRIRGHIFKKAIAKAESIPRATRTPSMIGLRDFYTFYLRKIFPERKVIDPPFDVGLQYTLHWVYFSSRIGFLLLSFGFSWKPFLVFFYPEMLRANPAFYEKERNHSGRTNREFASVSELNWECLSRTPNECVWGWKYYFFHFHSIITKLMIPEMSARRVIPDITFPLSTTPPTKRITSA